MRTPDLSSPVADSVLDKLAFRCIGLPRGDWSVAVERLERSERILDADLAEFNERVRKADLPAVG